MFAFEFLAIYLKYAHCLLNHFLHTFAHFYVALRLMSWRELRGTSLALTQNGSKINFDILLVVATGGANRRRLTLIQGLR